ncbi:MbcA/ParS/Xre antitoxin family protein [Caballeronia sp. KNU42]
MTRKKTKLAHQLVQFDPSDTLANGRTPMKPCTVHENSFADLARQVEKMVAESGNPEGFDAGQWLAAWMERSVPALGGKRPAEYMATAEGRALISRLLAMMQSGAYA